MRMIARRAGSNDVSDMEYWFDARTEAGRSRGHVLQLPLPLTAEIKHKIYEDLMTLAHQTGGCRSVQQACFARVCYRGGRRRRSPNRQCSLFASQLPPESLSSRRTEIAPNDSPDPVESITWRRYHQSARRLP